MSSRILVASFIYDFSAGIVVPSDGSVAIAESVVPSGTSGWGVAGETGSELVQGGGNDGASANLIDGVGSAFLNVTGGAGSDSGTFKLLYTGLYIFQMGMVLIGSAPFTGHLQVVIQSPGFDSTLQPFFVGSETLYPVHTDASVFAGGDYTTQCSPVTLTCYCMAGTEIQFGITSHDGDGSTSAQPNLGVQCITDGVGNSLTQGVQTDAQTHFQQAGGN